MIDEYAAWGYLSYVRDWPDAEESEGYEDDED